MSVTSLLPLLRHAHRTGWIYTSYGRGETRSHCWLQVRGDRQRRRRNSVTWDGCALTVRRDGETFGLDEAIKLLAVLGFVPEELSPVVTKGPPPAGTTQTVTVDVNLGPPLLQAIEVT